MKSSKHCINIYSMLGSVSNQQLVCLLKRVATFCAKLYFWNGERLKKQFEELGDFIIQFVNQDVQDEFSQGLMQMFSKSCISPTFEVFRLTGIQVLCGYCV